MGILLDAVGDILADREVSLSLTIEQLTHVYNIGYNTGHNDTVEGVAAPAHHSEMQQHHADVVFEVLSELD